MILVREKKFNTFAEGKNELLDILPIYTQLYITLNETSFNDSNINIETPDIYLHIDTDFKFVITFNNDQFMYLNRSFNNKNWEINYERSMGLTSRDINMILNN